ncbi:DUF1488 family protein [Paraburkholderia aromaticivorans]|uniref:DUF1488 family protein n=1 Tax=Paraburkholderia aromaticivorans TaxID=2026199 RepID=UPI001455F6F6|nr:DUF1488 family protein [Paraburkholderia aromaticivorans]
MDIIDLVPDVTPDRRAIVFRLPGQRGDVECAITREVLEAHFWLPAGADEARMSKAFADGRQRIVAVAERQIRLRPGKPVRLTIDDFLVKP